MGSVVDGEFKLKNTMNARVVDGSVIPSLLSGSGLQAPIVMMAERAADIIMDTGVDDPESIEISVETDSNSNGNDGTTKIPKHSEL